MGARLRAVRASSPRPTCPSTARRVPEMRGTQGCLRKRLEEVSIVLQALQADQGELLRIGREGLAWQRDWPTSRPRPGSARRPSAGCSTASPGVADDDPPGGPHRPRRPRLRAPGQAAAAQRRARRADRPRADNPIFPAFAQVIESALAQQRLHAGAVHPVARRRPRGRVRPRCCSSAASPASSSSPACTPTPPPTPPATRRCADRGLPIVLVNGYVEGVDAPFISNDDVASMELAVAHLVELGHRRIGLAVGPGPVHRRSSARSPASATAMQPPARVSTTSTPWIERRCSASRAAAPRPSGCSTAARPPSSAART